VEGSITVFILAGGLGTRIRSLFPDHPKPLIPIYNRPFLEWQIRLLAQQGFTKFVLCLSYLSEQIVNHFGDGSDFGIEIKYSIEPTPLGTGGALKYAAEYFQQTILLVNGDTYLETNYQNLIMQYNQIKNAETSGALSLVYRQDTDRYGRVDIDEKNCITSFIARSLDLEPGLVNSGVYILEPSVLEFISPGQAISLENEILPGIIKSEQRLLGIHLDDAFIDMGTPEGYENLLNLLEHSQQQQ
jgi:mannose-1-phosphate guanylyltransferase